jgi:catechol 2,3-dioxygenase-like lactoylglutathione lyase family enzyme
VTLDHCVIAVSDWEKPVSHLRPRKLGLRATLHEDVIGAEVVSRGAGYVYRLGSQQLNVHGPGVAPDPVARDRVRPGNSDLCFRWDGPIADAVAHLERCGVEVELGPVERHGALGTGTSVYFRDPDGSLMEFIAY